MANRAAGTYEVDPVSRIEGHLGIKVTTDGTKITDARAHGNLWRGFENFLLGRDANDAITFVQRICGVCPVPHGMTATYAVDSVLGYSEGHITFADNGSYGVPNKAVSIRNLVCSADSIMSAITHFYHLAAPSYIQGPNIAPWTPYFANSYYTELTPTAPYQISMRSHGKVVPAMNATDGFSDSLWSTVIRSYVLALRIRRLAFEAGALFAGRMPMTSTFVAGGVTFDGTEDLGTRCDTYLGIMKEVALFVIQEYIPIALALGLLYSEYDNLNNTSLVATASSLIGVTLPAPKGYGSGLGRYLAWGAFPQADGTGAGTDTLLYAGGYKEINSPRTTGGPADFTATTKQEIHDQFLDGGTNAVKDMLTEDIVNSRYTVDAANDSGAYVSGAHPHTSATAAYPGDVARTRPQRSKSGAYTYMKAPRWGGVSCEVGPMARLFVSGLFVDNQKLAEPTGAIYPYYSKYVKQVGTTATGLHPAMVAADIAVVLLRAGLATLDIDGVGNNLNYSAAAAWISANVPGATLHAKIAAAYGTAGVVITGPIAAWVLNLKAGASTMDRLRARALECLFLVQQVTGVFSPNASFTVGTPSSYGNFDATSWISILKGQNGASWKSASSPAVAHGWGVMEAARGALMHHITQSGGKIQKYQCIVPTTWNGSPFVGTATNKLDHGAIEAACIDAPFDDGGASFTSQDGSTTVTSAGGVEVLRIAQSFDPCIACAIH